MQSSEICKPFNRPCVGSWPTLYPDPPVQGPSSYCGGKSRFDCKLRRIDSAGGSNVLAGAKIMTIYRMSGKNVLCHSQN